jgi:hypothetical protein
MNKKETGMEAFVTRSQLAALAKLRRLRKEFESQQWKRSPPEMTANQHRRQAELLRWAGNDELAAKHEELAAAINRGGERKPHRRRGGGRRMNSARAVKKQSADTGQDGPYLAG